MSELDPVIKRHWRHFLGGESLLKKSLSDEDFAAIEAAIAEVERSHSGEICFAVEPALPAAAIFQRIRPRARALAVYSELRIWDTEHNNGVLIYLLLADRAVEIVADRAAARQAAQPEWDAICTAMRTDFARGAFRAGVLGAVAAIAEILARPLPPAPAPGGKRNELPNTRVLR